MHGDEFISGIIFTIVVILLFSFYFQFRRLKSKVERMEIEIRHIKRRTSR